MKKLTVVEDAKALMTEGTSWSVIKWLREKKRVRKAADEANNALWAMQKEVKSCWSDDWKAAYQELTAPAKNSAPKETAVVDPEVRLLVKRVKEADAEADRAHLDAEATFDKAEKIFSTSMAREGARKAIYSWELYEKAIVKAEAGIRAANATK